MQNIVLPYYSDRQDGEIHFSPLQHVKQGIFYHLINSRGNPVLAEGIIPAGVGERSGGSQKEVSGLYNILDKNRYHASHLIPHELGGSNQTYNLVVLPREANQKQVRAFEIVLKEKALRDPLYLQVLVAYYPGRDYPAKLTYSAHEMQGKIANANPWRTASFVIPQLWH